MLWDYSLYAYAGCADFCFSQNQTIWVRCRVLWYFPGSISKGVRSRLRKRYNGGATCLWRHVAYGKKGMMHLLRELATRSVLSAACVGLIQELIQCKWVTNVERPYRIWRWQCIWLCIWQCITPPLVWNAEPVSSKTTAARITTGAALGGCRPDLSVDVSLPRRLLIDSTGRREIGIHLIRNLYEGVCIYTVTCGSRETCKGSSVPATAPALIMQYYLIPGISLVKWGIWEGKKK